MESLMSYCQYIGVYECVGEFVSLMGWFPSTNFVAIPTKGKWVYWARNVQQSSQHQLFCNSSREWERKRGRWRWGMGGFNDSTSVIRKWIRHRICFAKSSCISKSNRSKLNIITCHSCMLESDINIFGYLFLYSSIWAALYIASIWYVHCTAPTHMDIHRIESVCRKFPFFLLLESIFLLHFLHTARRHVMLHYIVLIIRLKLFLCIGFFHDFFIM